MGPIGNLSPGGSIALGILVGLLSTSVQSVGLTLQRKSHILEDEKAPHDVRRPPYRRRRWQLGMAMFVVANLLGSTVQISTLPLPVLSTLQAAGLVFNSICATLILGETFTRWSLGGTLLVSTGAVLIAIFGAIPSPNHDLNELLELLARKPFIAWMILQAFFVVSLAVVTDVTNSVSSLSHHSRFRLMRGISYGVISGDLSAHSLLFAKSAVELLIKSIGGQNQFVHWQAWAIVLGLVSLALCQLYYLHRGLKLVSTSVLYPLVFCVYNIIAILDGLIYFNQTGLIPTLHACLITLGTVILLSGVLALSWRLSDEQHAPGVGQSSLAPGLGLLDDTEGEEESLMGSGVIDSDGGSSSTTYRTFPPDDASSTPLTPTRKKSLGWIERAEIWDELQDQDALLHTPSSARNPETAPLLLSRTTKRAASHATLRAGPAVEPSSSAETAGRKPPPTQNRRRRRSTGFPGFVARRTQRSNSSVAGSLGSILSLGWWAAGSRDNRDRDGAGDGARHAPATLRSASLEDGLRMQGPGYRDESCDGDQRGRAGKFHSSAV
ncbi:NIPA-like protein 3 [Escovopsis weberi]|uniref:NIPA-like protein 3 n=1 Tax=Escovopsis weberi TaxID=150374 RepID=A0A0N0RTM1_ESCWE|nr:NIPA-like protein 3 [Escovopsis weberi]